VKQAIQRFQSGAIAAEVIEVFSPRGVSYGVAVHRSGNRPDLTKPLFAVPGHDVLDLIVVLSGAAGFVDHLLDGGTPADWFQARLGEASFLAG